MTKEEKRNLTDLKDSAETAYRWADANSRGALSVLRHTFKSFGEARAAEAAAAMAYYTLFSLFPLALALIGIGGYFLGSDQVFHQVVTLLTGAIPVSRELIESNIGQVMNRRGVFSIVGLIGLLWSGTGLFSVLAHHINRAWTDAQPRSFMERRLVALAMVGTLALFLLISLLSTPALDVLARLEVPLWGGIAIYETVTWTFLSRLVPWVLAFLVFLALYRWVPNTSVSWSGPILSAALMALAWEGAKRGFSWYVSSGLVRYQLVYGSLGAVVALLLWIYLSSWLVLLGAHLSASVDRRVRCGGPGIRCT
jgi:membrane protein